jgi:hypothetical protein
MGLFGANSSYPYLEIPTLQEVLLSKIKSILTGINSSLSPASNTNSCLREIHVSSIQLKKLIWDIYSLPQL